MIKILCQDIEEQLLEQEELDYLKNYAVAKNLKLEDIWKLMDQVWDNCSAGYDEEHEQAISQFYASPVWLLNGIFTEYDTVSKRHRISIAQWVKKQNPELVADFGGGYGSLARNIANICSDTRIKIVEPYPKKIALNLATQFPNLEYIKSITDLYDITIAQDVLEHVPDPLELFFKLLDSTKIGGYVITANCFYPVIKCHLPQTFHFRYSFKYIVPLLGCEYVGTIPGASHAQIYKRNKNLPDWNQVKKLEVISRLLFPALETGKKTKKFFVKLLNFTK